MKYFAYGSNMSRPRLVARVPGADRIGVFQLTAHALRFHKVSEDGSGKCDALFTGRPEDCVIGVLFEISDSGKVSLDKAEGLGFGYQDKVVAVFDAQGNTFDAVTYYATRTDPALVPYSWYLYHVIYGAKEAELPAEYLAAIRAGAAVEDPDRERDARERGIYHWSADHRARLDGMERC